MEKNTSLYLTYILLFSDVFLIFTVIQNFRYKCPIIPTTSNPYIIPIKMCHSCYRAALYSITLICLNRFVITFNPDLTKGLFVNYKELFNLAGGSGTQESLSLTPGRRVIG